jgi:predicted dehydrogenase
VRLIRGVETPLVSARDAMRTLAAILAIKESVATRRWVDLDEFIARHDL